MLRTRWVLTSIILVCFGIATVVRATPLDDAHQRTEEARRILADAERMLALAAARCNSLQREADTARTDESTANNALSDARQQRDNAARAAAQASQAIPGLRQDVARLSQAASDARPAMDQATRDRDQALARAEASRRKLNGEFEGSQPVLAAKEAMTTAQAALKVASDACLEVLRRTPAYAEKKRLQDASEASVKALRAEGSASGAELAAASQKWIDAKNALNRVELDSLAADTQVVAAQGLLKDAQASLKKLRDAFEKDLPSNPEMAQATDAATAARALADSTSATYKRATSDADSAQRQLSGATATAEAARDAEGRLAATEERARRDIDLSRSRASRALDQLDAARAELDRARAARDRAEQVYRQRQREEDDLRNKAGGDPKTDPGPTPRPKPR